MEKQPEREPLVNEKRTVADRRPLSTRDFAAAGLPFEAFLRYAQAPHAVRVLVERTLERRDRDCQAEPDTNSEP